MVKSAIIAGVGGQGILLASNILSAVCQKAGFDVKKSEVHGMSQRGGDVLSTVRWGEKVYSPIIGANGADYLLGMEKLESLRTLPLLKADGVIVVNDYRFNPLPVSSGAAAYPDGIVELLRREVPRTHVMDAFTIALQLGNARTMNIVMLGGLARLLGIDPGAWHECIEAAVPPKHRGINQTAFQKGYDSITG